MRSPNSFPGLHLDSAAGLLRNTGNDIVIFRRTTDTQQAGPNNFRSGFLGLRTNFHGYSGIYAGNTPRSLDAYKRSLPNLQAITLPGDIAVTNYTETSNAVWTGRAAARLLLHRELTESEGLIVVRPTPPFSFKDNSSTINSEWLDAAWVIMPPELYAHAEKQPVAERPSVD